MRKHIVAIVSGGEIKLFVVVLVEGVRCLGYDSIIRSPLFI